MVAGRESRSIISGKESCTKREMEGLIKIFFQEFSLTALPGKIQISKYDTFGRPMSESLVIDNIFMNSIPKLYRSVIQRLKNKEQKEERFFDDLILKTEDEHILIAK